jgi:hypothetical protein
VNVVLFLSAAIKTLYLRTAFRWLCVLGVSLSAWAFPANAGVMAPERMGSAKLCSAAASGHFGQVLAQEAQKFSSPEEFAALYDQTRCECALTCSIYQELPLLRFAFGRPGAQDMARYMVRHHFYLTSEMCWLENVYKDTPEKVTGDVLQLLNQARADGALTACVHTPGINPNWPWSWDGAGKPMTEDEWAKAYLGRK